MMADNVDDWWAGAAHAQMAPPPPPPPPPLGGVDEDDGFLSLSLNFPLNHNGFPAQAQMAQVPLLPPFPHNNNWLPSQDQMAPAPLPSFPHNNNWFPVQAQMAPLPPSPLWGDDDDDGFLTLKIQPVSEGTFAGDWRGQFPAYSRQGIVSKIMETLKRHVPFCEQEGLEELKEIAIRFEEKMYVAARSKSDYLTRISSKMLNFQHKRSSFVGNADSDIKSLVVELGIDDRSP